MRRKRARDITGRYHNIGRIVAEDVSGGKLQYTINFAEEGIHELPEGDVEVVEDPLDRLANSGGSLRELKIRLKASMMFNDNLRTGSLARQKIDVLPHQMIITEKVLNAKYRGFLIADDVGLGKTIEAGLIVRSLMARGRANSILIICPAGLTLQWREQMLDRFDEWFDILGTEVRIRDKNQWDQYSRMIASIQTLRMEESKKLLLERTEDWDLVIVDEAHHLSAREYTSGLDTTENFQLLKQLRDRSRFYLFLTATPHQGEDDRFAQLLGLLEPGLVKGSNDLAMLGPRINDLMGRNLKREVTDFKLNKLFKDHETFPHLATPDDGYRKFLNALENFVIEGMSSVANKDLRTRSGANFVLTAFLKIAASSPEAIRRSLRNRHEALTTFINRASTNDVTSDGRYEGEQEEQEIVKAKEMFVGEAQRISELLSASERVKDSKIEILDSIMRSEGICSDSDLKLLIFTEYRGTQDMLARHLEAVLGPGTVSIMNGSQDIHEKRRVIREFESRSKVLISTEAGGEGLDLQRRCHLMVNYDVPWNPMRLHQRTGRLDRYGQTEKVKVHYLVVEGTIDDKIQNFLEEKIKRIQQNFGELSGDNAQHLREEVLGRVSMSREDVTADFLENDPSSKARLERNVQDAVESYKRQKEIFSQIKGFDPGEMGRLESMYSFKDMEELVRDYLPLVHKRMMGEPGGVVHFDVPDEIKALKTFHGQRLRLRMLEGTFDRALAKEKEKELLGIGNPYIDAIFDQMVRSTFLCDALAVTLHEKEGESLGTRGGVLAAYLVSSKPTWGEVQSFDGVEFEVYDIENDAVIENEGAIRVIEAIIRAKDEDVVAPSMITDDVGSILNDTLDKAMANKPRQGRVSSFQLGALVWYKVE